jgi:hypothetical protein
MSISSRTTGFNLDEKKDSTKNSLKVNNLKITDK